MTDLYLNIPYIKKALKANEEPRILLKIGVIYEDVEEGKKYRLTNPVNMKELSGTYFDVMVTGFCDSKVLVQPESSRINKIVQKEFFLSNNAQDYRILSSEEYYSLYPQEELVLPGRYFVDDF